MKRPNLFPVFLMWLAAGSIYAATVLQVPQGGTAVGGFPVNSLILSGTTTQNGTLSATSSPVIGWLYATSTTATSTFSGGLYVSGGAIRVGSPLGCTTLQTDANGNINCAAAGGGSGLTSLNGLTGATQTFAAQGGLTISSGGTVHTFTASSTPGFGSFRSTSTPSIFDAGFDITAGRIAASSTHAGFLNLTSTASSTLGITTNLGNYLIASSTFATLNNLWTLASTTIQGALNVSGLLLGDAGLTIRGGTVSLPVASISNAALANSSLTVTAGTGLSGCGLVSLGGTITCSLISPVVVGNGGTGATTFTANGVLYGNGISAIGATPAGATDMILVSAGGAPFFSTGATTTNLFVVGSSTIGSLSVDGRGGGGGINLSGNLVMPVAKSIQATTSFASFQNLEVVASSTHTGTLNLGNYLVASTTFATFGNIWTQSSTTLASPLNVGGTATSTFENGINIRSGCFAVGGDCLIGTTTVRIRKPTAQTINNSAVLTNDTALYFDVGANETWIIRVIAIHSVVTVAAQHAFTAPAGSSCAYASLATLADTLTCGAGLNGSAGGQGANLIEGTIVTGSTPGTINFQWAQVTATLEDTTLNAGSFLQAFKIGPL